MKKLLIVLLIVSLLSPLQGCGLFNKRLVPVVQMWDAPEEFMNPPLKLKTIEESQNDG